MLYDTKENIAGSYLPIAFGYDNKSTTEWCTLLE